MEVLLEVLNGEEDTATNVLRQPHILQNIFQSLEADDLAIVRYVNKIWYQYAKNEFISRPSPITPVEEGAEVQTTKGKILLNVFFYTAWFLILMDIIIIIFSSIIVSNNRITTWTGGISGFNFFAIIFTPIIFVPTLVATLGITRMKKENLWSYKSKSWNIFIRGGVPVVMFSLFLIVVTMIIFANKNTIKTQISLCKFSTEHSAYGTQCNQQTVVCFDSWTVALRNNMMLIKQTENEIVYRGFRYMDTIATIEVSYDKTITEPTLVKASKTEEDELYINIKVGDKNRQKCENINYDCGCNTACQIVDRCILTNTTQYSCGISAPSNSGFQAYVLPCLFLDETNNVVWDLNIPTITTYATDNTPLATYARALLALFIITTGTPLLIMIILPMTFFFLYIFVEGQRARQIDSTARIWFRTFLFYLSWNFIIVDLLIIILGGYLTTQYGSRMAGYFHDLFFGLGIPLLFLDFWPAMGITRIYRLKLHSFWASKAAKMFWGIGILSLLFCFPTFIIFTQFAGPSFAPVTYYLEFCNGNAFISDYLYNVNTNYPETDNPIITRNNVRIDHQLDTISFVVPSKKGHDSRFTLTYKDYLSDSFGDVYFEQPYEDSFVVNVEVGSSVFRRCTNTSNCAPGWINRECLIADLQFNSRWDLATLPPLFELQGQQDYTGFDTQTLRNNISYKALYALFIIRTGTSALSLSLLIILGITAVCCHCFGG